MIELPGHRRRPGVNVKIDGAFQEGTGPGIVDAGNEPSHFFPVAFRIVC